MVEASQVAAPVGPPWAAFHNVAACLVAALQDAEASQVAALAGLPRGALHIAGASLVVAQGALHTAVACQAALWAAPACLVAALADWASQAAAPVDQASLVRAAQASQAVEVAVVELPSAKFACGKHHGE